MRCNPWRWLWGLIPMAMLSWITFNWERGNIEADLGGRAQEELGRQGQGWAVTEFSGRDAVLRGRAAEDDEPKRALESLRKLWGVRVVDQRTDLIPKADVYTWLASVTKGKLVLSGHVPSEAARKSVLSVAKANFPKLAIEDVMQMARGAPPQDVWLGGANFALRQLAQLNRGTADLNGVSLSVAGEAMDASAYKSVRTALGKLPAGIKLGREDVTPAVVSPFLWSAKLAPDKLVLSGHVPDDRAREDLFGVARKKFGKMAIIDRMEVAGGAPDGWAKTAALALEQLGLLEDAAADLRGVEFTIAGRAPDQATAEGIRKSLRGQLPAAFKVTDRIEFPVEPDAAGVDYEAQWKEAEARWAAQEASRPPPPAPAGDGEPWWKIAQQKLTARPDPEKTADVQIESSFGGVELRWGATNDDGARRAAEERDRKWRAYEARWAALNDEQQRRRAAEAERDRALSEGEERDAAGNAERQRRLADEEARRLKWLELEARWAAYNDEYTRQRQQEEERRRASLAVQEERKAEADKCQVMMRDVVKNGRILFKTGSANLDITSAPTLNELVKAAGVCPNARIEISGHTDSVGNPDSNKTLSEKRARAIVAYLTKTGLDAGRMSAVGYGQTRPVAPNDTAANKAKNRRIEFTVVPN